MKTLLLILTLAFSAQGQQARLQELRNEFIKASNDYKANLEKLRASYEKSVGKAQSELEKSKRDVRRRVDLN